MVYFKIREGNLKELKVGHCADDRRVKRTKELQTGSPERLIDYIEPLWGHGEATEHAIHKLLDKWRIYHDDEPTEWFKLNKKVDRMIRQLCAEVRQADMSLPLFAWSQQHDIQIFQLEENLGAARLESQQWEKNAKQVTQMWIDAKNAEIKFRNLYSNAMYRLEHPNANGLAGLFMEMVGKRHCISQSDPGPEFKISDDDLQAYNIRHRIFLALGESGNGTNEAN